MLHLRHASAVALMGWYLIVPPLVIHNRLPVDLAAPLSEWKVFSMHDSAADCEKGLLAFYKAAQAELIANPASESDRIRYYQLQNSQCFASEDPLLQGK